MPGTVFSPDHSETSVSVFHLQFYLPESSGKGSRYPPRQVYRGDLGRALARHRSSPACFRKEGAVQTWVGIWAHLIRSEERLVTHKRSLPTAVDKLPQQSWRTYLVKEFSLNRRFYGFYFVAWEKKEIISN